MLVGLLVLSLFIQVEVSCLYQVLNFHFVGLYLQNFFGVYSFFNDIGIPRELRELMPYTLAVQIVTPFIRIQ